MARLLLVHGSAHGAWCWRDAIPALRALGHEVEAIDLPSHGDDPTPVNSVTLDSYAHAILEALAGPTVLIGHSMGGYSMTRAAEIAPEHVAGLIYLCAYTPWPGLSLAQMRMQAEEQPLLTAIQMADDRLSFTLDPALTPNLFYHDCPEPIVEFAQARLCPQAVAPSSVPVDLSERSQSLPRRYIVCSEDRTIPPAFQRKMAARFAPEHVAEIASSHSPFFSMPARLADTIDHLLKA